MGTPKLIWLNGPPGIGKSTLARRYVADHPLALCLDLDEVRNLLGGWRERPLEAGLLARARAEDMIRGHLRSGHDVVVPQLLEGTFEDVYDQLLAFLETRPRAVRITTRAGDLEGAYARVLDTVERVRS